MKRYLTLIATSALLGLGCGDTASDTSPPVKSAKQEPSAERQIQNPATSSKGSDSKKEGSPPTGKAAKATHRSGNQALQSGGGSASPVRIAKMKVSVDETKVSAEQQIESIKDASPPGEVPVPKK